MDLLHVIHPLYVVSGFAVGFLVGMTGVGGGSLMTPLLILLFHVHPVTAVGTDLIYACITKTGGSAVHAWGGSIDWRIVRRLALGSLPAAALTMLAMRLLDIGPGGQSVLVTRVLGVALLCTAAALLFRRHLLATYANRVGTLTGRQTFWWTVATGAALGLLVTISSVGAGALGVTALILLYPELPVVRIAGSDIAHAVPLTLLAGMGHLLDGGVDKVVLVSLLCGSLPGIMLSSLFAPRLPDRALRLILAGTLTIVALRLLWPHA
ncbi:MAG: sulfite exporter TauE/SafE family protein [Alphaproteobacteria bacterium]|nr:sulfite exporter TauE/SafE family protein [Alphaproteobacteria bacterium]